MVAPEDAIHKQARPAPAVKTAWHSRVDRWNLTTTHLLITGDEVNLNSLLCKTRARRGELSMSRPSGLSS